MFDKRHRQTELLRMIENEEYASQWDLVQAMRSRGFDVTQPSVSRDFKELGVVKSGGRYIPISKLAEKNPHLDTATLIKSVDPCGPNMVVVKTAVGAASVVAATVDDMELEGFAGTVAGDDTIFIAVADQLAQTRIVYELNHLH